MEPPKPANSPIAARKKSSQEVSQTEPLKPENLFIAARKIKSSEIEKVLKQLGVPEENIDRVRHDLKKYPLLTDATVESYQFLLEWRSKYPAKCTLANLVQALRELGLNKTAADAKNAVMNDWEIEESSSEHHTKCQDPSVVDDSMEHILTGMLPNSICTTLGCVLKLSLFQMDRVANTCKADNTQGVSEVLKMWRQAEEDPPVLGSLYRALRLMDKNALAEEVYNKCNKKGNT